MCIIPFDSLNNLLRCAHVILGAAIHNLLCNLMLPKEGPRHVVCLYLCLSVKFMFSQPPHSVFLTFLGT